MQVSLPITHVVPFEMAFGVLLYHLGWTSTMASTFTGSTSSTGPSAGSNRKRGLSLSGDLSPNSKKQKKQTKLDRLKADLKVQAGILKVEMANVQDILLNEDFAKNDAKTAYRALLSQCDSILRGENPTLRTLATFQANFENQFESEKFFHETRCVAC